MHEKLPIWCQAGALLCMSVALVAVTLWVGTEERALRGLGRRSTWDVADPFVFRYLPLPVAFLGVWSSYIRFRRITHTAGLRTVRYAVGLYALLQLAGFLKISSSFVFVVGLTEDTPQREVRLANEIV